jgi:dynein heavy chain
MVLYQTSNVTGVQKALAQPLEKKRKGLYAPPFGKRLLYFIDDICMSPTDRYGQQDVLEILRQYFDYNQWYDGASSELHQIEDVQFVGCLTCNPANPQSLLQARSERH